jgi:hypothetical protein
MPTRIRCCDKVSASTQQPDVSVVKAETMHLRMHSYEFRRSEPYGSPRRRVIRHLTRYLGCYADTYKQCRIAP